MLKLNRSLCSLMLLVLFLIPGCAPPQDELLAWVESNGGVVERDTTKDGQPVISVTITAQNVSDISPLAHFEQLQKLTLRACPVTDLSPLADLEYLKQLDLSSTSVVDLRPLSRVASLEVIDLRNAPLEDVDPLEKLPNLRKVLLAGSEVSARRALTLQGQLPDCEVSW